MNTPTPQTSNPVDQSIISIFRSNLRMLEIFLTKKLISKKQYKRVRTILENAVKQGQQSSIDNVFEVLQVVSAELIIRECFKYNQIFIKLAQQLLKNTLVQKFNTEQNDKESFEKQLSEQKVYFSNLLGEVTNNYLEKKVTNIEVVLMGNGLFETSQLNFLHNSLKHLEIKAMDRKFGEIAVVNKFTTEDVITKALLDQTQLYLKTNKNHIIGDILVHQKKMNPEIRDEVLLLQNRILEEDWEDTLRSISKSLIEEQEKNAIFGVLVVKANLMKEEEIKKAIELQNAEREAYQKNKSQNTEEIKKPRWIGDILVEDFGLSEKNRRKIVKKQMKSRITIINLKLGGNIKGAQRELIHHLDSYFKLIYSKDRVQAHLCLSKDIPSSMTTNNMMLWLYNKKVTFGISTKAIKKLLENKIKPGEKILVAQGQDCVPEKLTQTINFKTLDASNASQIFPPIVSKDSYLLTLTRIPGQSGLNVNRGFVAPSKGMSHIVIGDNVIQKKNCFLATCDGVPNLSEKGILSVSPVIVIPADLSSDSPAIDYDCDVDVHGLVNSNVRIKCRKLTANNFNGHVIASGDVMVKTQAANAKIISKGSITIPSVFSSTMASEKNILIESVQSTNNRSYERISDSTILCDDYCIITNSKLNSSKIQAKNKIILRKTMVGNDCTLLVGDSFEVISKKTKIKELSTKIQKCSIKIDSTNEKMQILFGKLEKEDISAINIEIESISKQLPKTKSDMDKIRELKKDKRKLERDSKKKYEDHGDLFLEMSNNISVLRKMKHDFEENKLELEKNILALYKKENDTSVIDAKKATLSKGLILKFRHIKWELDTDYEGFIFSEEFNTTTKQYEIKRYRW